jgi:hypothetical protein
MGHHYTREALHDYHMPVVSVALFDNVFSGCPCLLMIFCSLSLMGVSSAPDDMIMDSDAVHSM